MRTATVALATLPVAASAGAGQYRVPWQIVHPFAIDQMVGAIRLASFEERWNARTGAFVAHIGSEPRASGIVQ